MCDDKRGQYYCLHGMYLRQVHDIIMDNYIGKGRYRESNIIIIEADLVK